jgi:hypothetical protein
MDNHGAEDLRIQCISQEADDTSCDEEENIDSEDDDGNPV